MSRDTEVPISSFSTVLIRGTAHINFLYAIAKKYSWLNMRWLITGEGKMIEQGKEEISITQKEQEKIKHLEKELGQIIDSQAKILTELETLKKGGKTK